VTWICIIDDDPQVGDVLVDALRGAGYGARSFVDGNDALAAIDESLEAPRLVLLDLIMPTVSGHDVLRRIRIGALAGVPVVVVTGLDDVTESSFDPWRVSAVLHKPIAIEELLAMVARVLSATPTPTPT
jgi:DNA-binding response OmpR family regulator